MNKGGLDLLCFLWQGLANNVPTRTGRGRKPNNMGTMQEQNKQRGFTLVELITVMVIIGILAVAVLPRFFTVSDFEDRGSADQVKSLLRFAQKTAIAQHQNISVAISGGASSSNCTTTLTSGNLTCAVKSALTGAGTYTFDALGRPSPNAQSTVTIGGTAITIELETGYVH